MNRFDEFLKKYYGQSQKGKDLQSPTSQNVEDPISSGAQSANKFDQFLQRNGYKLISAEEASRLFQQDRDLEELRTATRGSLNALKSGGEDTEENPFLQYLQGIKKKHDASQSARAALDTAKEKYAGNQEMLDAIERIERSYDSARIGNAMDGVFKVASAVNNARTKSVPEEATWFKSSDRLDNGYDFGDITLSGYSTAVDAAAGVAAGFLNMGESMLDASAYGVGAAGKLFGADEFAEDTGNMIAIDLYDANDFIRGDLGIGGDSSRNNSFLGDKSIGLSESFGQMAGTMALQAVGVPWELTTGLTSFGSEAENAFRQGAGYWEAGGSALVSAAAEILTEKLFGGSGLGEKGLINTEAWTKGISNKLVKKLADFGVDVLGEGGEEVISQFASNLGSALYREENLAEILASEEAMEGYLDSFLGGMAMGGIMNGGKVFSKRDYRTGLKAADQDRFNRVYENRVKQAQSDGKKLTSNQKAQIYDTLLEEIKSGQLGDTAAEQTDASEGAASETKADTDTLTAAVNTVKAGAQVSNKQAERILSDAQAVEVLEQQTGMELPEKMSGRRAAVKEAVVKLVQSGENTAESDINGVKSVSSVAGDTAAGEITEGSGGISEGNVARLKSTGQTVQIQKIASIKDGKMTLQMADGTKVDARDVEYGSADEAVVYETVAGLAPNAAAANLMLKAYTGSGVSAQVFAKGMTEAYTYGSVGMPIQQMMQRGSYVKDLKDYQINVGYQLGQMYSGKKIAKELAAVRRGKGAKTADTSSGKVHFEGDRSRLNEIQKSSLGVMEVLAKSLGVQIYVENWDGTENANKNGWYDPSDGSIHINLNAGMDGKGTMLFTVSHELTHFIRQWSPAKFKVLANFLMKQYGKRGVSVRQLIDEQIAKAKVDGRELTFEEAYEEVVADSMEAMLNDGSIIEKMAQLKQQDKALWEKIRDWFKDLAGKLRAVVDSYKGATPDSTEGRLVADMKDVIGILESLYQDALVDASENYNAAGAQKNTAVGGVKYQLKAYTDKQIENWKASKRIIVYNSNEQLNQFIRDSIANNTMDKKMYFGAISADLAKKILADTGVDVENYNLSLGSYEVRKIIKDHGNESKEALRGQRAVVADDFAHIVDVVLNPSKVALSEDQYMGKPAIIFTGEHNGRMNVVAVVSGKRLDLFVQTVFVNVKKGNLATPTGDQAPINTPEANSGTVSSKKSIRNPELEVKKKFSLREPVERTKNLVALHNLTEDKLLKALDLGGFPMPSIAVTKSDIPHANFGDITLVFGSETIDPKANRKNTVYSADAWTPTFPRVEYEADEKLGKTIYRRLGEAEAKVDAVFRDDIRRVRYGFEDNLNRYGGENGLIESLLGNYGLKAAYLEETGQHIAPVTTQVENNRGFSEQSAEKYKQIMAILGTEDSAEIGQIPLKDIRERYGDALEQIYPGMTKSALRMGRILSQVRAYIENQNSEPTYSMVTDMQATKKAVDDAIDREAFEGWVRRIFTGIEKSSGVYNQKPLFTPSGNRRSFQQTHLPVTLENIVKAMAAQNGGSTKNISGFNGIKTLRAGMAQRFRSIADMHAHEGRLQNLTEEQFNAVQNQLQDRMFKIIEAVDQENNHSGSDNSLIRHDTIGEILMEISEGGRYNVTDIQEGFSKNYRQISDETALEIKELLYDVSQMPVNIFEAKPERAVGFDEVKVAVLPNGTSPKITEALKNRGIQIRFYEKGDNESRRRLINSMQELKFSSRDPDYQKVNQVLEQENAKLKEDVAYLKELVKIQRTVTNGTKMSKSSVDSAAVYLKKVTNAKGNTGDLSAILMPFYEYIASEQELTWEGVKEQARPGVQWLRDHTDLEASGTTALEFARDRTFFEQELLQQVYDSYWRVSTLHTVADVKQRQINRLKGEHLQRMEKLKQHHAEQVDKLKQEHRQRLEKVRQEYRDRADSKVQKITEKYQESRQKGIEGRKKTEMRRKIRKTIQDLSKLLNHGTKERNVKEGMRDLVSNTIASAEVLFTDTYTTDDMIRNGVGVELTEAESKLLNQAMDILAELDNAPAVVDTQGMSQWYQTEKKLQDKLARVKNQLEGVFQRERQRLDGTTVTTILGNLSDAYGALKDSEDGYISGAYDENVDAYLKQIRQGLGSTRIMDMRLDQLEALYNAYTMVMTTVRNANKSFGANLKKSRQELAQNVVSEVRKAGGVHGQWSKGQLKRSTRSWNNEKPVYAFERLGSETMTRLYNNLRQGEDVWVKDVVEAREFFLKNAKKYSFNSWDFKKRYKFTSSSGAEFDLDLQQIMSIYAYSKREQALNHLMKGGFVFDASTEVVVEKGIRKTYQIDSATAYGLTPETFNEIAGKLTAGQKGFVDAMQDYLSNVMGEKGNEISMQLYGIKLFNEEAYFPLRSSGAYMEKAKVQELQKRQGSVSIKNSGFTNATTPKASNPVVLSGFMDVWANHVNDMSLYHGFVLPLEDFTKVYYYSTPHIEGQGSHSVNQTIIDAYGRAATGYIDQLLRDVNGGVLADPRESDYKAWISKFKKASVMLSASVVIQQPSAIVRAFAFVDPKYFGIMPITRGVGKALGNKITGNHTQLYEELKRFAPVAAIKQMGYFDTNMGMTAVDFLTTKEYEGFKESLKGLRTDKQYRHRRFDDAMGFLASRADEITWVQIWQAVKKEVADKQKLRVGSEAHLMAAGERFTEVISKTQVYDSVFARSANMRSKGALMSMTTSFMAEPTTTANMLTDAVRKAKKGDVKFFARVGASVGGSILFNNILRSIIYAMRDDDEDETYIEKYLQALTGGILDDAVPLNYLPFWRDVWSLAQGYDVERADMSVISTAIDAAISLAELLRKDTSEMTEEQLEAHNEKLQEAGWKFVDSIASMVGIPEKNLRRDINGVINFFDTLSKDFDGRKTTGTSLKDKVWEDLVDSVPGVNIIVRKDSKTDDLYDAIIRGDRAYVVRFKAGYKDDSAYHKAIRTGLRENDPRIKQAAVARVRKDIEEYKRIALEIIGEGHFSQDDVVLAIMAEVNAMDEESATATTAKSKGLFSADDFAMAVAQADDTLAEEIKADILVTNQKNGKTEEQAMESFVSAVTSACKDSFLEGGISDEQVIYALVTYCDKSKEDAKGDVAYWDYKQDNPDAEVSAQWFDTYYKKVEDSGIDIDTYVEYRNQKSGLTKRDEILEVIDAQPISRKQKDALYFAEDYAESTLHKAPWH